MIDYGMSNLHSVVSALRHVGEGLFDIVVTADPKRIEAAERVVFPGQGAAADCMAQLESHNLVPAVTAAMQQKPFLGICMGMQVLLSHSEENSGTSCLGYINGEVRSFREAFNQSEKSLDLKIPHMGWNSIRQTIDHPLWFNIADQSYFYFVHSYFADPESNDVIAGSTEYGISFTSALARNNIFAMQCHPEKSADSGLQLLKNFLHWNGY